MSIAQFVLQWDLDGVQARNVLHLFHPDADFPSSSYIDVATALTTFVDDCGTQISDLVTLEGLTWQDVTGAPPYVPPLSVSIVTSGVSTNPMLPTQIAMYCRFITTNPVIRYGGFYLGGFVTSSLNGAVFSAGATAQIQSAWESFRVLLAVSDLSIAVARVGTSGSIPTTAVVISDVIARSNPSALRSRKRGVGI